MFYYSDNPNGFATGRRFSVDEPCGTVMAAGMLGDSLGHWTIEGGSAGVGRLPPDLEPFEPADSPYHLIQHGTRPPPAPGKGRR